MTQLKAEIHCHSNRFCRLPYCPLLYDSVQTVEEIIEECIRKDIRVISITDHDTLDGWREAKKLIAGSNIKITLIPGCEISSGEGHILAYGITKEIKSGLTAKKTVELIHKQGGLACAAHPYMLYSLGDRIFNIDFDMVEVFNSALPGWANNKCEKKTKNLNIPKVYGSDAHLSNGIGMSTITFSKRINNFKDFKNEILAKRFKTEGHPVNLMSFALNHIYLNFKVQTGFLKSLNI